MHFKQNWQGKNCRTGEVFAAQVPGNIQYDFGVFKNFGDVNYADNYKKFIPYEDDAWEYFTTLEYDKKDGERIFFVTEGIIYKYDILLNGETIYSYEGMFKPVEIDLSDLLRGNDELRIHIYPLPKSKNGKAGTRDEADESCIPPICYGWDWNPRLLISGMWQDAFIETRGEGYIGGVEVLASLDESLKVGSVNCRFYSALPCEISLFDRDGKLVHKGDETNFEINTPNLWWCNGQGEPYLYRYEISNGVEAVSGFIGFKRLRLVRNANSDGPREFPKGRYEAPITIELNGRRIFAKGSNWVNPDLFWGKVEDERYEKLVALARDCNMNVFRIWGGAGLAKNVFYDLCDRCGILVWQEFMLACNNYKGIPSYMATLRSEASAIIRKLRSHPSLALWCGGNELFNSWSGMTEQSPPLRLLDSLCFELDSDRPFLMTSPLYGMAHGGYTFYFDRQGGEVYTAFRNSTNTAYTEFGVPSISSVKTLREIIPEDELFPPRETDAWVAHHGYGAWIGDTWLCLSTLEKYFGKPGSIEELVDNSNWLQCEGYRTIFEETRKQWPRCSMAINWCYDEPWKTAANNSIIEYPTTPKPCYDFIKDALRPTLFSARIKKFSWSAGEVFDPELWLLNDSAEKISGTVSVFVTVGKTTLHLLDWNAETGANVNAQGPTARAILPDEEADALVLTLKAGNGLSSVYTLKYSPEKASKPTKKILNL